MNILFDYQVFTWQEYGGISRYCYELVSSLSKLKDCDVCICTPLYSNRYIKGDSEINIWGKYIKLYGNMVHYQKYFNYITTTALLGLKCPDIIHETYYSAKKLLFSKAKHVLTVHDMIHEKFPDSFDKMDNTAFLKRKAVERADHIICVSENTRNDLLELLDIEPKKVSVVHIASALSPAGLMFSESKSPAPYILYVGNRFGYKNFNRLLEAYAGSQRLKNDFHLACFGGGGFTTKELKYIKKLGISTDKILHYSGDDALLGNLYSHASAFVYPSLYEGFGIPPLEAMAFKCPVICSNKSSIPEVVGGAAEYFDPLSIENMLFAIESVLYSNDKIQKLIASGLERLKKYSWGECAKQTKKIYSML